MVSAWTHKDMYLTELSFKDARQFLDELFAYYFRETLLDFVGRGVKRVVFRGIDDARYENLPRAFRSGVDWNQFDFYAPMPLDAEGGDAERANYLFDHRLVELRAVVNFLSFSDKLGIPTPLNFYNLDKEMQRSLQMERGAKYEYLTRTPHIDHPFPGEEVREAFALAQHYGVPTRLLDWTESIRAAMFFSAASTWKPILANAAGYTLRERSPRRRYITVYGLGCSLIGKLGLLLVTATRHQNPRLRAQSGVFVLDPHSDSYFMNEGRWPSLEDRVRQLEEEEKNIRPRGLSAEARLIKWHLVASESHRLAKLLLDEGVSFETIFPSLESAAVAFAYRQRILPRS